MTSLERAWLDSDYPKQRDIGGSAAPDLEFSAGLLGQLEMCSL